MAGQWLDGRFPQGSPQVLLVQPPLLGKHSAVQQGETGGY